MPPNAGRDVFTAHPYAKHLAEDTAIPFLSTQHRFTLRAFVNLQTGIGRHRVFRSAPTLRGRSGPIEAVRLPSHSFPGENHRTAGGPILDSL